MEEPWKAVERGRVGTDQGEWSPRARLETEAGTGGLPRLKGVVQQVRMKTAGRDNMHRTVHQLVPLPPKEEVKVDNIAPSERGSNANGTHAKYK